MLIRVLIRGRKCIFTRKRMRAILFLLFVTSVCFSQDRKLLKGTVSTQHETTDAIRVVNVTSGEEVYTGRKGSYQIKAKLNDVLSFSHIEFIEQNITISDPILKRNRLDIFLSSNMTVLKELYIDKRDTLNASLGFGKMDMTPAEKSLYASNQFSPGEGVTGVKMDGLLNRLSGRNKMLKNWLKLETNETNVKKFKQVFPEEYLQDELKIKPEDFNLFIYTIVEQDGFDIHMVQKSITYIQFLEEHARNFRKSMEYED